MVKSKGLFDDYNAGDLTDYTEDQIWQDTKADLEYNIDLAISRGKADKETLEIMKELLDIFKPITTMSDYMEDDDSGA